MELRRVLRRYLNGRIPYVSLNVEYPEPEIQVSGMPRSANDLLLLSLRLKTGSTDANLQPTLAEIRRKAARHPNDTLALLTLGHAELHNARDPSKATEVLERLLAINPHHVEGLQYMARAKMDLAQKALEANDTATALAYRNDAQSFLRTAHAADDSNYTTLMLMAENRAVDASYPSANDLQILSIAFALAPQLSQLRLNYASALLHHNRHAEAIQIVEPLVNNPHGENADARALLNRAKGEVDVAKTEADTAVEPENVTSATYGEGDTFRSSHLD